MGEKFELTDLSEDESCVKIFDSGMRIRGKRVFIESTRSRKLDLRNKGLFVEAMKCYFSEKGVFHGW